MPEKAKRVLVTDASSYKAIAFCKALADVPFLDVFTADSRNLTRVVRTKYSGKHFVYSSCSTHPIRFINDLRSMVTHEKIDVLVPVHSSEMRLCLEHKADFGTALDCFGDYESFQQLDNKYKLARRASDLGIRFPKTFSFHGEVSDFPVIMKPSISSAAKGVRLVRNKRELDCLRSRIGEERGQHYLLQRYIRGTGVGFSVFCSHGVIRAACGHKRLAEFPVNGGSSTVRSTFFHPDMKVIAEKLIRDADWTGLAMFEFKLADNNDLWLIEVNPRVWGSINQAIQTGVNFPSLLIGSGDSSDRPRDVEVITYFSPLHFVSFALYILRQWNFSPVLDFYGSRMRKVPDVSIVHDVGGYLSMLLRSLG
jgi:predicted ATP-grasp superfamily ATP-dependent carboligase